MTQTILACRCYKASFLLLLLFCTLLVGCSGSPPPVAAPSAVASPVLEAGITVTGAPPPAAAATTSVPLTPIPPTTVPLTPTRLATPTPQLTPAPDVAAIVTRSHIPILSYHHIRDWVVTDSQVDKGYIVPIGRFVAQMDFLATHGWHTISPDQLQAYLTAGTPLPDKPIMLTFDDGDISQWTSALPELQKRHFTATFFVMTVTLDKPNYLSTEQVKALDKMGMTIGAHTWDHHRVTRYTGSDWQRQITDPTKQLADITGRPIKYFAYPYGLWNEAAIPHLKAAGFVAAYQLGEKIDPTEPLFTIRRVIANSFWNISQFETAITKSF